MLHCGSFSKSLAPGYRIGWCAPGRFHEIVRQNKFLLSIGTNVTAQAAIADYLKHGGYELHLRRLRNALKNQRDQLLRAVARHFPAGTAVSRPAGGYVLWLQLPEGSLDTLELMRRALDEGVSLAPGALFSPNGRHGNDLRLNFGHPWSADMERGSRPSAGSPAAARRRRCFPRRARRRRGRNWRGCARRRASSASTIDPAVLRAVCCVGRLADLHLGGIVGPA